jgi:nicotinamidase-related amidase
MENTGVNLLIIDPQNDFYKNDDESNKGSLAVGGSQGDIQRIISMIKNGKNNIKSINVSLDTHTRNHIANASFWKKASGEAAPAFATVTVVDDKFVATSTDPVTSEQTKHTIEPDFEKITNGMSPEGMSPEGMSPEGMSPEGMSPEDKLALTKWFKTYCDEVNKPGRNGLMLWPDHCIEETDGHAVVPDLKTALDKVFTKNSIIIPVAYHIKGQNCLTEMFSIMKADVVIDYVLNSTDKIKSDEKIIIKKYMYTGSTANLAPPTRTATSLTANTDKTDHVYLNTKFNQSLFDKLVEGGRPIAICGEALTHCVLNSFVDIVKKIEENAKGGKITQQVWLIANASSPIPNTEGPAIEKYKKHVFKNGNDGELKEFIKFKLIDNTGELININNTNQNKSYVPKMIQSILSGWTQPSTLPNFKGGRRTRRNRRRPSATRKAKAPKNNRSARRNRRRVRSRSV